jgi:hypothetical protein
METLTASDFNFRARDVSYSPEVEMAARKYATGDFDAFKSISGKRSLTVEFTMDLAGAGGTGSSVPEWNDILVSCGLATAIGVSTASWETNADWSNRPATVWVQELSDDGNSSLQIRGKGMMGAPSLSLSVGGVPQLSVSYTGCFVAATAVSPIAFSSSNVDSTDPDAALEATVTLGGTAQPINEVSLDLGNNITLYEDISESTGYKGAYKTGHEPSVSLDPYLVSPSTQDHFAAWTGNTTAALNVKVGTGATQLRFEVPSMQRSSAYDGSDRDGFVGNAIEGIMTRSDSNGYVFRILQGK